MFRSRKTKVVATIGPASASDEMLAGLITNGMDVARLNFSHGSQDEHRDVIRRIRAISADLGVHVAIMQDLCGPKIRIGRIKEVGTVLRKGADVCLMPGEVDGSSEAFSVAPDNWLSEVSQGDRVLLNDGAVEMIVQSLGSNIICNVTRGGPISTGKGVNLPDTALSLPSVTEKDMYDLEVGIEEGVDFIALSFVRKPEDLQPVRARLKEAGCAAQLIAKIEKPEAIKNIEAIIAASDGILVARGDLGVETALEEVPFLQKRMVRAANKQDKYVIVATQMLESMAQASVPTRAEVSDVANAILDGADAVMLSVETSAGKYPMESLLEMVRIASRTDEYAAQHRPQWDWDDMNAAHRVLDAVGHAVRKFGDDLNPSAIITYSLSGGTALFVSKNRPACPVIAFTESEQAARRMKMFWGVFPVVQHLENADELVSEGLAFLKNAGLSESGSCVLSVYASEPGSVSGADSVRAITV